MVEAGTKRLFYRRPDTNRGKYEIEESLNRFIDGKQVGADFDIRMNGDFERGGDSCELGDFAPACPGIESFYITFFAYLNGRIHKDLGEILRADDLLCHGTDLFGRADETVDGDDAAIHEELRDLCNSADIFIAVGIRKSEVVVDPRTDVVAIENLGKKSAVEELLFQMLSQSGLPGARQSRKPDHTGMLVQAFLLFIPSEDLMVNRKNVVIQCVHEFKVVLVSVCKDKIFVIQTGKGSGGISILEMMLDHIYFHSILAVDAETRKKYLRIAYLKGKELDV